MNVRKSRVASFDVASKNDWELFLMQELYVSKENKILSRRKQGWVSPIKCFKLYFQQIEFLT
jgi:hypothetical protein